MTRARPTRVEKGDIAVARAAATLRNHPLTRLAGELSEVADQPPLLTIASLTLVAGALARSARMTGAGARMVAAHMLSTGAKTVVKRAIDRTRPEVLLDGGGYESGKGRHDESRFNSFPSGHTAGVVAVARAIGRDYPAAALPALAFAAGIAAVQIPRGKHYVSDIVAGALIGLAADAAVEAVVRRVSAR